MKKTKLVSLVNHCSPAIKGNRDTFNTRFPDLIDSILNRKTQNIGGEKITFTVDEVTNMKQMLPPGIRLLGFKPMSKVSLVNHLRSSLFLYPDENSISGSTTLFRALYEKCLAKHKAAYCMLTMRRKQPSK